MRPKEAEQTHDECWLHSGFCSEDSRKDAWKDKTMMEDLILPFHTTTHFLGKLRCKKTKTQQRYISGQFCCNTVLTELNWFPTAGWKQWEAGHLSSDISMVKWGCHYPTCFCNEGSLEKKWHFWHPLQEITQIFVDTFCSSKICLEPMVKQSLGAFCFMEEPLL